MTRNLVHLQSHTTLVANHDLFSPKNDGTKENVRTQFDNIASKGKKTIITSLRSGSQRLSSWKQIKRNQEKRKERKKKMKCKDIE